MHSEKINSKFFVERAKRYISVVAMPEEELFPIPYKALLPLKSYLWNNIGVSFTDK